MINPKQEDRLTAETAKVIRERSRERVGFFMATILHLGYHMWITE